jgi:hypothetical protein
MSAADFLQQAHPRWHAAPARSVRSAIAATEHIGARSSSPDRMHLNCRHVLSNTFGPRRSPRVANAASA